VSLFADGVKIASGTITISNPSGAQVAMPERPDDSQTDSTTPPDSDVPAQKPQVEIPEPQPSQASGQEPPDTGSTTTGNLVTPRSSSSEGWRHFGESRPDTRAPRQASQPVEEARITKKVQPVYPSLARKARVQGLVRLSATIGTDGKLHNIRVISGHSLLTAAAVAAVQQWRYTPSRLNGEPIEAETQIDVNFTLGE
jgi:protein TonB